MNRSSIIGILVSLIVGIGGGYVFSYAEISGLQSEITSLGSEISTLITDYTNLNTTYNQLSANYSNLNTGIVSSRRLVTILMEHITNYQTLMILSNLSMKALTAAMMSLQQSTIS